MNIIPFDGPLFILGSPRSGTSLLRLILTSHEQIVIPPECGFIIWLHKKYGNWQVSDNNDSSKLVPFIDDLFRTKKFDTWCLDKAFIEIKIIECQPTTYAELCKIIYTSFGLDIGQNFRIWGDKNNFYLNHLDELFGLFSNARFLHIVRDGRDVVCSYREVMGADSNSPYAPKLSTDINEIATEWSSNVMTIDSFMSGIVGTSAMTIRYEDLTSDFVITVTRICKWLGLEYDDEMLGFYQKNKKMKLEPDLTLGWKRRTLQPISNLTVGRYITHLSDKEKDIFLSKADIGLHRFLYL